MIYHTELTKAMTLVHKLSKIATEVASFNRANCLTCNERLDILDSGIIENYILPQFEILMEGRHKNFFAEDKFGNVTLYNYMDMRVAETNDDDDNAVRMIYIIDMGNKNDEMFGRVDPFQYKYLTYDVVVSNLLENNLNDTTTVYGYFVDKNEEDTRPM